MSMFTRSRSAAAGVAELQRPVQRTPAFAEAMSFPESREAPSWPGERGQGLR